MVVQTQRAIETPMIEAIDNNILDEQKELVLTNSMEKKRKRVKRVYVKDGILMGIENTSSKPFRIVKNKIVRFEFTKKETYHYNTIRKFFLRLSPDKVELMLQIINGSGDKDNQISLRLIDYFMAHYSKKHKTHFPMDGEDGDFYVHVNYRAQLKSYKKKYFDPFRRRERFYYCYDPQDNNKVLETTLCQLNCFRWLFSCKILNYLKEHHETVNTAMLSYNRSAKAKRTTETETNDSMDTIDSEEIETEKSVEVVKKKGTQIKVEKLKPKKGKARICLNFDDW